MLAKEFKMCGLTENAHAPPCVFLNHFQKRFCLAESTTEPYFTVPAILHILGREISILFAPLQQRIFANRQRCPVEIISASTGIESLFWLFGIVGYSDPMTNEEGRPAVGDGTGGR